MKKVVLAVAVTLVISGCSSRVGDFTLISTKNNSNEQLATAQVSSDRAKGEDTKSIIIIVPTGTPSMKEATDEAIESVPCGIALKDATLHASWFYIPYIYGQKTVTVEGNVMQDSECLKKNK